MGGTVNVTLISLLTAVISISNVVPFLKIVFLLLSEQMGMQKNVCVVLFHSLLSKFTQQWCPPESNPEMWKRSMIYNTIYYLSFIFYYIFYIFLLYISIIYSIHYNKYYFYYILFILYSLQIVMPYITSYLKKSNLITLLELLVMRYPHHWLGHPRPPESDILCW